MHKLILNAAGDQFFLPDSSKFYWDDLQGEKYIRYIPNADHGMDGTDAIETIVAFYSSIVQGTQRPKYTWSQGDDGSFDVQVESKPKEVRLWQATNPLARDFRLETLGKQFTSKVLTANEDGSYSARVSAPQRGWTAYFVELTFDTGGRFPFKLTTNVRVTPDTLPYQGRSPTDAASVTFRCEFATEADAQQIFEEAGALFKAKLSIDKLLTKQSGSVCYLNWVPSDYEAQGKSVMGWLQQKNCRKINIQLESGRTITAADTEE